VEGPNPDGEARFLALPMLEFCVSPAREPVPGEARYP